jgi:hypothetical protein
MGYINITPGGTQTGWIGNDPSGSGLTGSWFNKCWIGGTAVSNAPFVATTSGLTITGAKLVVESTSGTFTKTVTIDPLAYSNPIEVANNAGSKTVIDCTFFSVGNSSETSYFSVNQLQINDPFGEIIINGTKVLGTQQSDPGNSTDSTDVATRFNNLLSSLRTHGII